MELTLNSIYRSRPIYRLKCEISFEEFMAWERNELRTIEQGTVTSKRLKGKVVDTTTWTDKQIPAAYHRIVAQLLKEDEHARLDKGHEALRRQSYVQRVLDTFWLEVEVYAGDPVAFRSMALTPLLQRQLWGLEENYSPSVRDVVSNNKGTPTITQVTEFYLGEDPTDPGWIPNYKRNLVQVPEVRWHLAVVMGLHAVGNGIPYNRIRANQDLLTHAGHEHDDDDAVGEPASQHDGDDDDDGSDMHVDPASIPLLTETEVQVIFNEGLEEFFEQELERVVGTYVYFSIRCS